MTYPYFLSEFVKRPGLGRSGRVIKVRTNYFEITVFPFPVIYHYDIKIIPAVPPTLNRKIYRHFEDLYSESRFHGIKPVYDGLRNLFTAEPLPFANVATFDITLPENDASAGNRTPHHFKVRIRKVARIDMEGINRFINGRSLFNAQSAIMALNVLINHKPSMMYAMVGRSFYTNQGSRPLYGGLEVWQGYFQSAKPTPGKMMINIGLHATAFYESGDLIQMVVKILNKKSVDDLRRITDRDRTKLSKVLKNLKVYVTNRGGNKRLRITGITNTSASNTKFEFDGRQTDVASYFQRTYNRCLQYPFLPCVIVRRTTALPMEICNVAEGQRYLHKLNDKQTADMMKFTCQPPYIRANKINQGPEILSYQQNEYMQQFGLRVSNEMAVVQARVLPPPKLQYHPSSREASFVPRDGTWNLREKKVATGATLGSWACAVFGSQRDYPLQTVQKFIRELVITCQDTGMNILNKTPPIEYFNPHSDIEKSLKIIWTKAGNAAKSQPQLILCILPNTGVPLYAEIKRVSDTAIGVASQCVQGRHVYQAKKYYCVNVCLKMNVKLGGMNSFISPTQVPFITQRPTILIGAAVNHLFCDASNRPSIAALCASMDAKASRYATSIRIQTRQEIINDLADMVKELLKTFYQCCGRKPERILFYRDGLYISEDQFDQLLKSEIIAVKAACESLDTNYRPTITFVVVQKQCRTRFFPMDKKDSDRSGNCLPGTVVETTIVHPFGFDFYLQSHAGLQGTSCPTHYYVLFDENGFSPDSLQTLSYNLCYVYARSTRAVSIVPPVYYARLACSRTRFHASGENWGLNYASVKPELQKVMYFM